MTSPTRRRLIFRALYEVTLVLHVFARTVVAAAKHDVCAADSGDTAPVRTQAASEAAMLELLVSTLMPSCIPRVAT